MAEKSNAFGAGFYREHGDGDFTDLSDWEPAFHAIRCHLERNDLFVGLTRLARLDVARIFRY